MNADPSRTADFDRDGELAFVRAVLAGHEAEVVEFEDRIKCVPRILHALNGRRGRPLGEHDLGDLLQDTFSVVWRKLDQFEGWAPLEGWLFRLCQLEFMNAVRRRARLNRRNVELVDQWHAADGGADFGAHDDVHLALMQLGGVEADTIRMKFFHDLTFQEIGERLRMPVNTVKTRYYRGLTRLEALIRTYRRREERA